MMQLRWVQRHYAFEISSTGDQITVDPGLPPEEEDFTIYMGLATWHKWQIRHKKAKAKKEMNASLDRL